MRPSTGTEYSDDFSFEFAQSSSAPPHNQRRSSANSDARTDWEIVRKYFARNSDVFEADFHLRTSNGSVRSSVAKLNSLFSSADGSVRMRISSRCRGLIADLGA